MQATATDNETQIQNLIDAWARAAGEKDIDGIMAHHAPDLIAFDVPPPERFTTAEAYAKHWASFFPMTPGKTIFEPQDLKIVAGEDVAFATCLTRCGGAGLDGKEFSCIARTTLGFRKIAGQWTFLHEHHSMPMTECPGAAPDQQ